MPTSEEPSLDAADALMRATGAVQRALESSAAAHGVSETQARLLRVVGDGAPTINALAQLLGLDKSSTSGLVDRAQQRGLVRRVRSQLDRRAVRVRVTAQGHEIADAIATAFSEDIDAMLERLPARDRATLTRYLDQILTG